MENSLAPGFLVAAPPLTDPNFAHALVLLIEHNDEGAIGIVINDEREVGSVGELLAQLGLNGDPTTHPARIRVGGPVHREMGWIVFRPSDAARHDGELRLSEDVAVSPSRDVLAAIAEGQGPDRYSIYVGCAGWGPGQLEQELAVGAWLPSALHAPCVFDIPVGDRWQAAFDRAGVDPAGFMSSTRGQA